MHSPDRNPWPQDQLWRIAGSLLFALTGVLFLAWPAAGSSCGEDEALIQVCLNGVELLTGEPSLETHGFADESGPEDVLGETIVLPSWLTVLAVGVLLCSVSGIATILIIDQRLHAVLNLTAALAGLVFIGATGLLAYSELFKTLEFVRASFSTVVDAGAADAGQVAYGSGFWSALGLLGAVATAYTYRIARAHRNAPPVSG
jgi:hypothetical protein